MPSFLLIISFLIHIILLIAVYYLFQQTQLLKQTNTKELTDLFETYLNEIKQENRRLETKINSKTNETKQAHEQKRNEPDTTKEKKIINKNEMDGRELKTDIIDDTFTTSLEAQVLQLYQQGKEVEEIAQMLNCGKTEAELIINLSKKRKS